MEYIVLIIAVVLLGLAYKFNRKFHKLRDSGRIADLISADLRSKLFLVLAVVSLAICFVLFRYNA